MKKFYVLLAAMLIASISFAQISTTKKVVKTDGTSIVIKGKPASANQSKAVNSFWFNLIDDAITYYGEDVDGFAPPVQCDTNNLYPFSDGNSHVQFCSVGQVYDWDSHWWNDFYDFTGAADNIPHMPSGTSYSVDSIQLIFRYERGTNVPTTVVDTVAISYIMGFDPSEDVRLLSSSGNPVFVMPALPYNNNTFMASTTSMTTSGFNNTLDNTTIVYDKVALTADDTTGGYFYYLTLPAPADLANLSPRQMAVTVTFIPGCDRTPNSLIGTDLNTFRTPMYDDPREGYDGTWGTPEILEDYQVGLFTDADNYTSSAYFYNVYQPNLFWSGNPKPYIGLHITCNDFGVVNVPEVEKNNITVYPNPATNNFTVNLGNDEKASIQLFNLVGQQVYSETFTSSTQVNVSNLRSGVYMLKVNQNGKVTTTKVVVK